MGVLRTADETYGGHAVSACVHAVLCRLDEFGVVGEAEVVIRAEIDHLLTTFDRDTGGLRGDDHAFVLIETCILDLLQSLLQMILKILIHNLLNYALLSNKLP